MGRRRRRGPESGLIEDTADLIVAASRRWPLAGLLFFVLFLAFGLYLRVNPTMMVGFAPLFGTLAILAGVCCGVLALVGFLRDLRNTAASPGRLITDLRSANRTNGRPPALAGQEVPAHREVTANWGLPAERTSHAGVWTLDAVQALSWQQFERLIANLFRRQGYTVRETGRDAQRTGTGDGGVDLILTAPKSPGAEFLVQCKQYKVWSVGEPKVREFYGAMAAWKTGCEGMLITCGRFTQPAEAFAAGKPLRLIDGDGLLRLLHQHNPIAPAITIPAPPAVQSASRSPAPPTTSPRTSPPTSPPVPACPNCQTAMVRRTANKGPRKGQPFWGCVNYPACKAIINIARSTQPS